MTTKLTVIRFNRISCRCVKPDIRLYVPDNCVEEVLTRARIREAVTHWQSLGLMPEFADGSVLVWKHVQKAQPPERVSPKDSLICARAIYDQLFGTAVSGTRVELAEAAMDSLTNNSDEMDEGIVYDIRAALENPKKRRRKEPDKWKGNLGFEYLTGKEFQANNSMACAGPMGCIKEWLTGDHSPHLLAIRTPMAALKTRETSQWYSPPGGTTGYFGAFTQARNTKENPPLRDGVFVFNTGIPVAVYQALGITEDGCDLKLVEGMDVLPLIGW